MRIRLHRFVQTIAVATALLAFAVSAQAPLDVRVALVIGNAAYAGNAALANPVNDALAVADTLKQLGFEVVELRDSRRSEMGEAIAKVREALKGKQGIGMLYYAGHGLQLDWRNYMVPVDAKLASAADVATQAVDVSTVLDAFKTAGNRMNIMVLDACRDNPFASTASGKGLAQVDAPPGTLLAYATAPGNVAEDGNDKDGNGLYTRFLLQELKQPNARIEDVFKRVRLNVRKQSQGRQIPWESTSLEDDFYFNRGVVVQASKPDSRAREQAFLAEKADWDRIKDSKNANDFYTFLHRYPSGFISEQAQFKLEQLQKAQTVAVANQDGVVPPAPTAQRYRLGNEIVVDVVDGFTKVRRRVRNVVTKVEGNRAEVNHGEVAWDQTGALLKNNFGSFTPGILIAPADLAVGKKWKSAYQGVTTQGVVETAYWDYHATGYEVVTVPEGTFKAVLVVGRGESRGPDYVTFLESRSWFDPASLRRVRLERIFRNNGKISDWTIFEEVSFKPGPV